MVWKLEPGKQIYAKQQKGLLSERKFCLLKHFFFYFRLVSYHINSDHYNTTSQVN